MSQVVPFRCVADNMPMNIEAEQAVLGQLLLAPDHIGAVSARGGRDLFGDGFHGDIFDAMADRHKSGRLVSPVTMREVALAMPGFEHVGGVGYLARLAGAAIGIAALPGYLDTLADLSRKRTLIMAMREAHEAIGRGEDAAGLIAGRLEAAMLASAPMGGAEGPVPMIKAVSLALEQVSAAYRGEALDVVHSGIPALDHMIGGFYPGELILIGGRPSMGKTGLALSIALNAARAGHGVCIASLEMNPEAMAIRALSEATAQTRNAVNYSDMRRGNMTEPQVEALRRCAKGVADLPITFLPRQYSDIGALFAGAKQAHRSTQGGLKLFVVDYAQLLRSQAKGRYEQITEISIALKELSGQLNIPVIALSQLSRSLESREDKRPMLSDLRESGQLEQDADAVLFCYRDEYYVERMRPAEDADDADRMLWNDAMAKAKNRLEIIVAKQRQGAIGTAHVGFNPALNLTWDV